MNELKQFHFLKESSTREEQLFPSSFPAVPGLLISGGNQRV